MVRSGLDLTKKLGDIKLRETEKLLNRSGQERQDRTGQGRSGQDRSG